MYEGSDEVNEAKKSVVYLLIKNVYMNYLTAITANSFFRIFLQKKFPIDLSIVEINVERHVYPASKLNKRRMIHIFKTTNIIKRTNFPRNCL